VQSLLDSTSTTSIQATIFASTSPSFEVQAYSSSNIVGFSLTTTVAGTYILQLTIGSSAQNITFIFATGTFDISLSFFSSIRTKTSTGAIYPSACLVSTPASGTVNLTYYIYYTARDSYLFMQHCYLIFYYLIL
jgi:hypothetical protein